MSDFSSRCQCKVANRRHATRTSQKAFTLVELLIVMSVIAILAAMILVALRDARETAKRGRTESQINRINELLMTRWEEYHSRQVPLPVHAGLTPAQASFLRYRYITDLMRMELPDRITDVRDGPIPPDIAGNMRNLGGAPPLQPPALWRRYNRIVQRNGGFQRWTTQHQGAECLYMILESMVTDTGSGVEFLAPSEVGDTDRDGFVEILDAWGNPIEFVRWAPGYESPIQDHPLDLNNPNYIPPIAGEQAIAQPDPFDPFKTSVRWGDPNHPVFPYPNNRDRPFALTPLVISAGPDGQYGIFVDKVPPITQAGLEDNASSNDPYYYFFDTSNNFIPDPPYSYVNGNNLMIQMGWRLKFQDGSTPYGDNVDNHYGINN